MTPSLVEPDVNPSTPRAWQGRDRRVHRPTDVASALICALDHSVARGGLDLMMVADDFGTVVTASSTTLNLDELAAVAPIVGRGRALATIRRNGQERELSVRRLRVLGETLYVTALGGAARGREREVLVSAAATRRILCS